MQQQNFAYLCYIIHTLHIYIHTYIHTYSKYIHVHETYHYHYSCIDMTKRDAM